MADKKKTVSPPKGVNTSSSFSPKSVSHNRNRRRRKKAERQKIQLLGVPEIIAILVGVSCLIGILVKFT